MEHEVYRLSFVTRIRQCTCLCSYSALYYQADCLCSESTSRHTCQPKILLCRTKSRILQDILFLFLQDTPCLFQTYLKNHRPYTSNTINFIIKFYIKMQDTNFAGHLAEFAAQQDGKKQDNPAKSRTVGNSV